MEEWWYGVYWEFHMRGKEECWEAEYSAERLKRQRRDPKEIFGCRSPARAFYRKENKCDKI